ncbi:MAG: nucleotidyl transferase AbiEii/AbiGii toxin family protein, partial [Hyphomicrobiales bacterium]|nr:nucleotidyl transferase AbiEii/AbiGii toxin family protein [Hyphomicrobiales bacterium]
ARAIAATFARRGTAIPVDLPDALSPAFAADELKQQQWRAFLEDAALNPGTLAEVTDDLAAFLMPHAGVAAKLDK